MRRWACNAWDEDYIFQSTHPTRECDSSRFVKLGRAMVDFNPRTLQENATTKGIPTTVDMQFQSTHPTRECDTSVWQRSDRQMAFQSTHPIREFDCQIVIMVPTTKTFQSTHPIRECDLESRSGQNSRYGHFNPRTL